MMSSFCFCLISFLWWKYSKTLRKFKGPKPKSAKLMGQRMAPRKEKSRLEPHIWGDLGQHRGDFGRITIMNGFLKWGISPKPRVSILKWFNDLDDLDVPSFFDFLAGWGVSQLAIFDFRRVTKNNYPININNLSIVPLNNNNHTPSHSLFKSIDEPRTSYRLTARVSIAIHRCQLLTIIISWPSHCYPFTISLNSH